MRVLLFANGIVNDGAMLRRALDGAAAALILCADGGALHALRFALRPRVIIGDLDSLTEGQVADFAAAGADILSFPADKDETDLELALQWASEQGAKTITILGALGGRLDQTLANIHLLSLPCLQDIDVDIVDGQQSARLLRPGDHEIGLRPGDALSLIPLIGPVTGLTTRNLQYPLRGETLAFGPARGISNVALSAKVGIAFHSGSLLVVHTCGRA